MKKKKIVIIGVLLVIICVEAFLLISNSPNKKVVSENKDDSKGAVSANSKEKRQIETKYLVDLYSSYYSDNLNVSEEKTSSSTYPKISGLKNKEIEGKVNESIKNKVLELEKSGAITSQVISNFENTLSVKFENNGQIVDGISYDLTTGNVITIEDVLNDTDPFKDILSSTAYGDFVKKIAFVCGGGPCSDDNPDLSPVEDEQFSVISKYTRGKYSLMFTEEKLYLIFKDVKIKNVLICSESESGCRDTKVVGFTTKVKDTYENVYVNEILFKNLVDNLTIYNKFKTDENIYEKDRTPVDRKFTKRKNDYFESRMELTDNYLIDYDLIPYHEDNNISNDLYSRLKKEMVKSTNNFNVYNVFGYLEGIDFGKNITYISCNVYVYPLDKASFEKYKKQIYLSKYDKVKLDEGTYFNINQESELISYPFIDEPKPEKKYFYYIYKDQKKIDTKELINIDYLKTLIPNYNNEEILLIIDSDRKYNNALTINYSVGTGITITFKNNVKTIKITDSNFNEVKNNLFK